MHRPDDAQAHEMLAATYQQLGQTSLAETHRNAAVAARAKQPFVKQRE